jgi:2-amino-4-hydroxy-6-hydroxymethyldihydropteridine diphosphokinase
VSDAPTHCAYIGIGSNLGDARGNVERALRELEAIGTVRRRSSLYRTAPWGNTDQPAFVNAVALVETPLPPRALLEQLQNMERRIGRVPGPKWGPRAIDLDVLTYGDLRIAEDDFIVPHPYMQERAFVLVPLAEIDPAYESMRDALGPKELESVTLLTLRR